jgi:hypothetical protein
MTFRNPILGAGGSTLLRPAIQSPNYIHGVSGWSINRVGDAEFNDLTIRGTYMGQNYVIGGDGVFFYNGTPAAGNLTGSWAPAAGTDPYGNAYPEGLQIDSAFGSILLSAVDGVLQSIGSSGRQVVMGDGSLQWSVPGSTGNGTLDIGATLRDMVWNSGELGAGDRSGKLGVTTSTGTPTAGATDTFPRAATFSGLVPAHHYVSGAMVKSDLAGNTAETWQTSPAYTANWSASTTFNGATGWSGVQFRRDAEDNLVIIGAFKSGATVGGASVLQVPVGYRPSKPWPVVVVRNNAGTITTGMGQISTAGNLNLQAGSGVPPVAGGEYFVTGTVPLGNIA